MAIKDPNVLDRINTLNTNLENGDIAKVEKNISKRLFGVLEGVNNISVDSELYASINDVTNASDLTTRISGITFEPVLNINGTNIRYTNPSLLPHTNTTETQSSIDNITSSENDLTSLKNKINNLRTRFEDNIQRLGNIRDEQIVFTGTPRNLPAITAETNNQQQLKIRVQKILRTLSKIINEQNGTARPAVLNNLKLEFDGLDKSGITDPGLLVITNVTDTTEIANKHADYITISTDTDNRIEELKHEHELRTQINGLKTVPIHIPNGFLTFGDAETITSAGVDAAATQVLITNFETRLTQLNNFEIEIPNISTRYAENKNKLDKILQLQKLQDRLNASEITRRHDEFEAIRYISNHHLLLRDTAYEPYIPNQTINVGGNLGPVNLDFVQNLPLVNRTANYSLCDGNGNPLRNNGGRLEIQQGGQTINIRGVAFDNTAQTMRINNLEITPIEGVTFPLALDLNVRVRIHDNATGLDVDHHKPIHIEITRPTLNRAIRENAYDSLVPPMNDRIQTEYTNNYRENLENDAIWSILREGGNEAEVNEIYNNEARRNMFIDRIRRRLAGNIPLLDLAALQAGFRGDMTRENRDVPVQYLLNQNVFQNYVRQSIPNNLKNYATEQITNNARTHRDDILNEFLTFQTDVANGKIDNNDNLRVLAQVPGDPDGPQGFSDRRRNIANRRTRRRNNYTKFFQGRNASIDDQTLETEDGTIKYGINVEVLGVNRIVATINIDGKEEPEIIEAANHDRLIKGILSRANTKDGEPLNRKLRCNIALGVLKAMIMMSPQRLNREIPLTNFTNARGNVVPCDRIEAFVRGGNLRINGGRVDPAARTRQNVTIFDENQFKNLHDIDSLENGVRELSTQINTIMNATAREYYDAVSSLRENRGLLKYNTLQWLRGGPVKRLWGRMKYGKTNTNFDFDTSVNEAGKDVNISFKNGLFTVSGEFDGQNYEYKAKDLGSILRKKINRKRIFDGVELAMVAAINEEYISRLRTNNLVQTENFAVADLNRNKTGRIYIFDEDGNLSYLEIEDRVLNPLGGRNAGRIDPARIPMERIRCNEQERKEFMQNPLLAGRLQREMRRRLTLF